MSDSISATRRSVVVSVGDHAIPGSVDVLLGGHRVWSTTPPSPDAEGRIRLTWPLALVPYLKGRTQLTIQDSATGEVFIDATLQIGRSSRPLEVKNANGRWLAVNKWQRMGSPLEGDDSGMKARLIAGSKVLVDHLQTLGYTTYITGGTLLGAVRLGNLLPHDDDTDLAILLPHSHPSDLSLDSYRLEDHLTELGYVVVRHSTVHLQVMSLTATGEIDHYIDIFSAFYRSEQEFCQPFHVRAAVPRSSIVPIQSMDVAGVPFPVPAVPADWLVSCYGPNWATPDPSFRFVTPLSTRRRFENWFGSQNTNRIYWETQFSAVTVRARADADARFLRELSIVLPKEAPVADLGCGTGMIGEVIADHGHEVVAVDYSYRAIALAREAQAAALDVRYLNLYDRRRLLEFGAELVRSRQPWHFTLSHVLEGLTIEGRANVFLFLRLVLTAEAFAFVTIDTNFITRRFRGDNPETWHLPVALLREEAARQGLIVGMVSTGSRATAHGRRKTATAQLRRDVGKPAQG